MSRESFSAFVVSAMKQKGFTDRSLAGQARVGLKAIADARSGKLEKSLLEKSGLSNRKLNGVRGSIYRILIALGEEPETWMTKLGLPTLPQIEVARAQTFESRLTLILQKPLSADEIEQLGRAQKELGELFIVEIALRLLIQKHNV